MKFDFNQQRELFRYDDKVLIASIEDGKLRIHLLDSNLRAQSKGKAEISPNLGTINEIGFVIPLGLEKPICLFRGDNSIYAWDFLNKGEIRKAFEIRKTKSEILSLSLLPSGFLIRRKDGAFERYDIAGEIVE